MVIDLGGECISRRGSHCHYRLHGSHMDLVDFKTNIIVVEPHGKRSNDPLQQTTLRVIYKKLNSIGIIDELLKHNESVTSQLPRP